MLIQNITLSIARARCEDVATVHEFHRSQATEFIWPRTPNELNQLADEGALLVARANNTGTQSEYIVGMCYVMEGEEPEGGRRWEFGGLCVSDEFRGYGIGSALGVLGLETDGRAVHVVSVEAKYYSGLSSEEDERPEPNNQLARELDNLDAISPLDLGWKPELDLVSRTLLFVTQDMGIPRSLLAQSLAEYKRKRNRDGDIFWASWRVLPSILEQNLEKEGSPRNIAVMEDMLKLLFRKRLTMFRGVEPITEYFTLLEFYQVSPRHYSWPHIPETVRVDYKFEVIRHD